MASIGQTAAALMPSAASLHESGAADFASVPAQLRFALSLPGLPALNPSLVSVSDNDDDDDDDDDNDDDDDRHGHGSNNKGDEHRITYYVRTSGSDTNDGLTPDTAFATIQKAVNRCTGEGYTIYVGPGTYTDRVEVGYGAGTSAKSGKKASPNRIIGDTGGTRTGDPPGPVTVDVGGRANWGIMIYQRDYWSVHSMTIKGSRYYGIYCGIGKGQEVHDCTVFVDGYYGILSVLGEDARICNNRLVRGSRNYYMIYAYASQGTVVIDGNRFNLTGDDYLSTGYGSGKWGQRGYNNSPSYFGILAYCYSQGDAKLIVTNNIGSDVLYGIYAFGYNHKKTGSDFVIAHNVMSGCYYGMYNYCYGGQMLLADNVITDSYVGLMSYDYKGSTRISGLLTNNITFRPVWMHGQQQIEGHIEDQDPMWLDPSSGNFLPTPGSPLIDAGLGAAHVSLDIRELSRPLDGNGDNVAQCDLGAYEYDPLSDGTSSPVIVMWREVESQSAGQ